MSTAIHERRHRRDIPEARAQRWQRKRGECTDEYLNAALTAWLLKHSPDYVEEQRQKKRGLTFGKKLP